MTQAMIIYNFFKNNPEAWMSASEVFKGVSAQGVTRASIYNTLSVFSLKEPNPQAPYLLRRGDTKAAEYRFNSEAPERVETRKPKSFKHGAVTIIRPEIPKTEIPLPKDNNLTKNLQTEASKPQEQSVQSVEPITTIDEEQAASTRQAESQSDSSTEALMSEALKISSEILMVAALKQIGSVFGAVLKEALVGALTSPEVKDAMRVSIDIHHYHHHHGAQIISSEKTDSIERRADNRPPRPKIGIVSNRDDIFSKLRTEFPNIDFIVTARENSVAAERVRNCDRVIAMTKFISHETTKHVKRLTGERYYPVAGAEADVKRQIQLWISTGQIIV